MKKLFLGAVASVMATAAHAGSWSYSPEPPALGADSDPSGALLVLLVVGAVMLLNGAGGLTSSRSKNASDAQESQDDDDILMKF